MALTYIQQPPSGSFQASDTPITYVFSSNQTTQPNFSYIVETLLNNVVVSTDMVFPEKGSRAHFDASKVTLPATRAQARTSVQYSGVTLPTLRIRVSERYGTTPVTQTPVNSDTCKILKACCDDETYSNNTPSWVEGKYTPSLSWLTDVPAIQGDKTFHLSRDTPFWASILNTDPDVTYGVAFYDMSGSIFHLFTSSTVPPSDKVNLYFTPDALNTMLTGTGSTLEDVSKVRLEMNASDPLYVVFIDGDCGEYNQLSWLNNLGTYDQFLFTHNREQEAAINAQEYKKQFGSWDNANAFTYDHLTSGDTTYLKTIQPTGSLYSGYVSQETQNWLNEIYNSVDTLLHAESGFEKILVTNQSASKGKTRFDDILNFQVNYKKTNFKSINQ